MGQPRTHFLIFPLSLTLATVFGGAFVSGAHAQDIALVQRALRNELEAAQDDSHPMRYQLHKSSPRLATTKNLIETKDGAVAMLAAVNDKPLSQSDAQKEQQRLDSLLADPGKQRHRKKSEDADTEHALAVVRVLPSAFLYQYAGQVSTPRGPAERFTFQPNPKFDPPNMETQLLKAMTGELWIDPVHSRVVHLEGHLAQDVDFVWGILGRLSKGGWISLDQAEVGKGQWRVVKFQMDMSARVVFKTRIFRTVEVESNFEPVPVGLNYRQGIALLRGGAAGASAESIR